MTEFVQRLPVRVAALSGLVVGSASWFGGASPLGCLERVGVSMGIFGLLGVALRALLANGGEAGHADHRGQHLDATTPGMSADDLSLFDPFGGEHGDFS